MFAALFWMSLSCNKQTGGGSVVRAIRDLDIRDSGLVFWFGDLMSFLQRFSSGCFDGRRSSISPKES